jgi:hypothetical protein
MSTNFFFEDNLTYLINVTHTPILSKKWRLYPRHCFEFVWKGGIGHHGIGFGKTPNYYIRYSHGWTDHYYGGIGFNNISVSGDFERDEVDEPVLLCLKYSDPSFIMIKGEQTRIVKLSHFSGKWHLFSWNALDSDQGSDLIELHLTKNSIINTIPDGMLAWDDYESRRQTCIYRKSLKSPIIIFLTSLLS